MGLLQFAYHFLTTCVPCPYNFVTVCYMPRIDSKLRRGAVLGLLQFAYPFLTTCFPCPYNFLCYMPRVDSQMKRGFVSGMVLFAYHLLTNCSPCPYNVLTICYMCRIDSKLRGEPFWSCCCLHTISLPIAYLLPVPPRVAGFCSE